MSVSLAPFGLLSGKPGSPTNTFDTIQFRGLSTGLMSALVTSSESPRKARPQGESNSGLESRRISLPDGSSTAIWFGPSRPTYRLPDLANAIPEAWGGI